MEEQRRVKPRKRKMTKKRRRRIMRAWFFRILFVLMILLALFLVVSGVRFVVKGVSHLFGHEDSGQEEVVDVQGFVVTDEDGNPILDENGDPVYATDENGEVLKETEVSSEPVITTLTLTATGDCTLAKTQAQSYDGSFYEYYDSYGADWFFDGVRDIFSQDDLTLINLECVLTDTDERVDKEFNLKGKPEYTAIMTGSSVEAVSLGNNHSADYGEQSTLDTEKYLDEAGIVWAIDQELGYYTTADGIKVGIVSKLIVTYTEEREQMLLDGIEELKANGAQLIVACCHWGTEKEYYPNENQKKVAHDLIDAGADLVIGNHPHVLQGVEVYNGKVICYSLGNFCFGGNKDPSDKNTMIYQQTFTFEDGVLQAEEEPEASIIPCKISSAAGYNDFQPTIATESKQSILDAVNEYSSVLGNVTFDADGTLVVGNDASEKLQQ